MARLTAKDVDQELLDLYGFFAGFEHLAARDDATGKVGAVGFCYGGGVRNALAVTCPELGPSVPFYGRQAAAEDVPRIRAPLLLHHARLDAGLEPHRRLVRYPSDMIRSASPAIAPGPAPGERMVTGLSRDWPLPVTPSLSSSRITY